MKFEYVTTSSVFDSSYDRIEERVPEQVDQIEKSIKKAKDYLAKLPSYDDVSSMYVTIEVPDTEYAVLYYIDLKKKVLEILKIIY